MPGPTLDHAAMLKAQTILEAAASEVSKLGFSNTTVSEMFFAYGIRIGVLVEGRHVFNTARMVIDAMEKQSTEG